MPRSIVTKRLFVIVRVASCCDVPIDRLFRPGHSGAGLGPSHPASSVRLSVAGGSAGPDRRCSGCATHGQCSKQQLAKLLRPARVELRLDAESKHAPPDGAHPWQRVAARSVDERHNGMSNLLGGRLVRSDHVQVAPDAVPARRDRDRAVHDLACGQVLRWWITPLVWPVETTEGVDPFRTRRSPEVLRRQDHYWTSTRSLGSSLQGSAVVAARTVVSSLTSCSRSSFNGGPSWRSRFAS